MDTKNYGKIPEFGSLPDPARFRIVVGAKQLRKAFQKGTVRYVFLAENADPAITDPIVELCGQNSIQPTWVATMADLGRACGIEVGAAAAAAVEQLRF